MTCRGLTLVEVLASTVLLAALAAACLPLMQRAMRDLDDTPPPFDLRELADLADALMLAREAFGLGDLATLEHAQVAWPDNAPRPPIEIAPVPTGEEKPDHAWIMFSCGGWQVYRWLAIPRNEQEAGP